MVRFAFISLFAAVFSTGVAARPLTSLLGAALTAQTPKTPAAPPPAADGRPAVPRPVQDVAKWTLKWLQQPVHTFLELTGGGRLITYSGGTCPLLSTCTGGKSGVIGADGAVLRPAEYEQIRAVYKDGFVMRVNKKFGFTRWDGQVLLAPNYEVLTLTNELYFEARSSEHGLQILNLEGKPLISGLEDVSLELEKLFWGQRGEKWGVYDLTGKLLQAHKFHEFTTVGDKVVAARVGNRWALVDDTGKQVTPLRYNAFNYSVNGLLVFNLGGVCDGGFGNCAGGRYGVLREDGKVLLQATHDCVEIYGIGEENDVEIRVITAPADAEADSPDRCTGGRVQVLKKDGTPWFKETFAYLDPLDGAKFLRAVKEGSCDLEGSCSSGKWGVVDPGGRLVVDYKYDWIETPGERGALFVVNKLWGLFDPSLKELVPAKYEVLHADKDALRFLEKGLWGVLDNAGKEVVPAKYEAILPFVNGVARFREKGKWGLVSAAGKVLVPAKHLAICTQNKQTHVFATAGKCIQKTGRDAYSPSVNAGGQVLRRTGLGGSDCECEGGTFGLMDLTGRVLLQPKYQAIQVQNMSQMSERREGRTVVFGGLASLPPGQVWVRLNQGGKCSKLGTCTGGRWGLGDLKGRVIVPVAHPFLDAQADYLVRVAKGGECEVNNWRPQKCAPETKWGLIRLEPGK